MSGCHGKPFEGNSGCTELLNLEGTGMAPQADKNVCKRVAIEGQPVGQSYRNRECMQIGTGLTGQQVPIYRDVHACRRM